MPEITIRRATPEDSAAAGVICYQAFHDINTTHRFPPDFPAPEAGIGLLAMLFSHPGFYCVVAESGGRIIGHAAHELARRGSGVAVVAICIGVGQGLAVVLER